MPASTSPPESEPASPGLFPVETEIYILPDGQVVVADLPAELAALLNTLTAAPSAPAPDDPQADAA